MKNYKAQLKEMHINRLISYENNENRVFSKDKNCVLKIVLIVPYNYELFLFSAGIFYLENKIKNCFPNAQVDFFFYYDFLFDHEGKLKKSVENVKKLYSFQYYFDLNRVDVLAFSFPNSTNLYHILNILDIINIPIFSKDRKTFDYPFILLGNNALTNPKPFIKIIDAFLFGFVINEFIGLLQDLYTYKTKSNNKYGFVNEVGSKYNHILFSNDHSDSSFNTFKRIYQGKDYLSNNDPLLFISPVITNDIILLSPNFGCKHKCSFCQFAYMEYCEIPFSKIKPYLLIAKEKKVKTIVINSLSFSQYTYRNELLDFIKTHEFKCIVGSFRPDEAEEEFLRKLHSVTVNNLFGKMKGLKRNSVLTVAPETPSCKTLKILNKGYTHDSIDKAIKMGLDCGYTNLCLYFMLGLPNEREVQNYYDIIDYTIDILKKNSYRLDSIMIKVHQFVPLALTELQRCSMEDPNEVMKNVNKMKEDLKAQLSDCHKDKIKIQYEGPNRYFYEVITSRGGSETGEVLVKMKNANISPYNISEKINNVIDIFNSSGLDYKSYFNSFPIDKILPWNQVDIVEKKREHNRLILC